MPACRSQRAAPSRSHKVYDVNAPITISYSYPLIPLSTTSSSTSVESPTSDNPTISILSTARPDNTSPYKQRVKRPPNAFMLFRMEYSKRQRDIATNDDDRVRETDISRNAAVVWRSLGPEGKKPWYEWANEAKSQHELKYPRHKFASQRKNSPMKIVKLEATSSSRSCSPLRAMAQVAQIQSFKPLGSGLSTLPSIHDSSDCSTLVRPDVLSPTDRFTLCAEDIALTQHLDPCTSFEGPHSALNTPTNFSLTRATMEQSSRNDVELDYADLFDSFDLLDEADFGYGQYNQDVSSSMVSLVIPPFSDPLHF